MKKSTITRRGVLAMTVVVILAWPASVSATHPPTKLILTNGDYLLNAITQTISLPADYRPNDLTPLSAVGEPDETARQIIVEDLAALMNTAAQAGTPLDIISSFRSFERQRQVHAFWHSVSSQADTFSAHAGHSEHQLGTAVDFGSGNPAHNFSQSFATTAQFRWLENNAWQFGFALSYPRNGFAVTGITFEPWQWRYIGRDAAREWHVSNQALPEFLLTKPQFTRPAQLAGSLLRTEGSSRVFYVADNGTKRWLMSPRIFESYGFRWSAIATVTEQTLEAIPRTKAIRLRGTPGVYRLNPDHTKQGIGSLQTLHNVGLSLADVVAVNQVEFTTYPTGPFIP